MEHLASPVVVALDIGTSSSRSVAYDCTGEMLPSSLASLPHDVRTTADGGAELDAEALLEESLTCLHRTEAALREAGIRPAAVCVSTFWHSLLGVDGASRAVTPVYM
ncbi:MAG: carbohydrate kinase, partial [Armatimonadetes bacterium]|nr:carbohydrate kinase [Armatimonadota bacterium]